MVIKAYITVIAVAYALQILCGAETGTETSTEEYEYGEESCLYTVLRTADNRTLSLNCTLGCGHLQNDSIPCVNATYPPLNFSNPTANYTCTVGDCHNGTCPSNGTNVTCWAVYDKYYEMNISDTFELQ
uniref:Evasin n=1 Tax=Rhipicephalus microplus TaxID=6941 RepID=A0A6G5A8C2_RHIMP